MVSAYYSLIQRANYMNNVTSFNFMQVFRKLYLNQGSQTRGPHVARQGCLCGPRPSQKMYVMRIFIEMLEFLCYFSKNVVKAIK